MPRAKLAHQRVNASGLRRRTDLSFGSVLFPDPAFDAARGSQVSPELSDFVLAFRLPVVSSAGFPRLGRKRGHKPAYKGRTPAAAI
jgi:hypothetical protein